MGLGAQRYGLHELELWFGILFGSGIRVGKSMILALIGL